MFQEIGDRMTKNPTEMKIKVVVPPESQYSVRIGGYILRFFLTHSSRCGSRGRVRWIWPDHRP